MDLDHSELDRLQQLAEAATTGPWHEDCCGWGGGVIWAGPASSRPGNPVYVAHPDSHPSDSLSHADLQFIVAANPMVVMALIERIRGLEWRWESRDWDY